MPDETTDTIVDSPTGRTVVVDIPENVHHDDDDERICEVMPCVLVSGIVLSTILIGGGFTLMLFAII